MSWPISPSTSTSSRSTPPNYGPPRPTTTKKWIDSVAGNHAFKFSAKLFHSFTHERQPAPNDEKDFKDGMAPFLDTGRLGAVLMQFPWSVTIAFVIAIITVVASCLPAWRASRLDPNVVLRDE